MADETPVISSALMDRAMPLGNSEGPDARRRLHVFVSQTEPVPISPVLVPFAYDAVTVAYPDAVTEVYSFKTGGASGTLVATVTVVYTSSSKQYISSVVRT